MGDNRDTITIEGFIQNTSEQAIFFSQDGETGKWVPKSQILDIGGATNGTIQWLVVPKWLAEDKGFV